MQQHWKSGLWRGFCTPEECGDEDVAQQKCVKLLKQVMESSFGITVPVCSRHAECSSVLVFGRLNHAAPFRFFLDAKGCQQSKISQMMT
jgi:hypothetical protein